MTKRLIPVLALAALSAWGCRGSSGVELRREPSRQEQFMRYRPNEKWTDYDDYKGGKIDPREYEARKQQIERGSII